ncbi:alanine/glycine:cation symporter family protein [Bacillus inaquosorum]|uniref:alanine/glycine:cation symporter family protein n=1 Tax=Bacillus inaquosorum TaxID=483913 RepID=UPI000E7386B9|nr:sodium:alanine symporter family protein [Bacillus inaquosorum]RKQ21504.1 sodium:alanine symporter family protein [Bacillus subtilis]MCY7750228.1 sodium:alanine symporter family protein [Bacillus inaquosorum]MCY7910581.1 sodium:alanine symporter family protein [Bacillus inaquosorum]MCY8182576.1 sodium:alanine symporter family protein [Bacillus inaquosorum]MCY8861246.1 sodium:alanine symporter family protein [Bacillus inaquosorum]
MERLLEWIERISDWLWGPPLIILLTGTGLYFTILLKCFQFRYPLYILKQTIGSVGKKPKGEGTVTPLQALTSALSSTIGAANIVGVPAAIMFGGPGAVFWMWLIALFAMAIKFSESVLAVHYREKNEQGEFVGGPMYYITKGLRMKWLGVFFSVALIVELVPSIMVQGNSVSVSLAETFSFNKIYAGIGIAFLIGLVVIGGVKRIGKVTEFIVPLMAGAYAGAGLLIVLMNLSSVPAFFSLIFSNAFTSSSAVGGFAGAALAETVRWGFARGLYSNEAGMGTAPIAHAAAMTDHPVRQGFWSVIGIVIDTLIICTTTAFVVLASGVWTGKNASNDPAALTTAAFQHYFGSGGGYFVSISLVFFVVSTIMVVIFYGVKQAEFLFGRLAGHVIKFVYLAAIIIGAAGGAKAIWGFLDLALAFILVPNVIALLLLSRKVKALYTEFFTSEQYYLKDRGKTKQNSVYQKKEAKNS